jgi:transcriptional regulator with PAS, ATPase and Fis domain
MDYDWPGNVRELEHTLEHSFILCRQPVITVEHLPPELRSFEAQGSVMSNDGKIDNPEIILEALAKSAGNKTKAAKLLGISRRSLYRKIDEFQIQDES